ncbi:V-type ATP synthase subunit K [bacterium]|nr:V-type ATP synthase subunit K [bacterium]
MLLSATLFLTFVIIAAFNSPLFASDGEAGAAATGGKGWGVAIGAAIAIGLSALASGIAQSKIGSAGAGALVEKPELFGQIMILTVIPETMVVFGLVIAVLIMVLKY